MLSGKLYFIKIKNFCSAKHSIKNEKTNHRLGEKSLHKELLSRIYQELLKLNT